jgi:hypothetical protein
MKVWFILVLDGVVKDATKAILSFERDEGDVDDLRKAVVKEWKLKIPAAELRVYRSATKGEPLDQKQQPLKADDWLDKNKLKSAYYVVANTPDDGMSIDEVPQKGRTRTASSSARQVAKDRYVAPQHQQHLTNKRLNPTPLVLRATEGMIEENAYSSAPRPAQTTVSRKRRHMNVAPDTDPKPRQRQSSAQQIIAGEALTQEEKELKAWLNKFKAEVEAACWQRYQQQQQPQQQQQCPQGQPQQWQQQP